MKEEIPPNSLKDSTLRVVKGTYELARKQNPDDALELLSAFVRSRHFACGPLLADILDAIQEDPLNDFSYRELDVFDSEGKGHYLDIAQTLRNQVYRIAFHKRLDRLAAIGATRKSMQALILEYVDRGKAHHLEFAYPKQLNEYVEYCMTYIEAKSRT